MPVSKLSSDQGVSCNPKKWCICKRSECTDRKSKVDIFMHMCLRDIHSEWHLVKVPSTQGRPHFKCEENLSKHTRDMNFLVFFFLFFGFLRGLQGFRLFFLHTSSYFFKTRNPYLINLKLNSIYIRKIFCVNSMNFQDVINNCSRKK